jgi:hypothetical protein
LDERKRGRHLPQNTAPQAALQVSHSTIQILHDVGRNGRCSCCGRWVCVLFGAADEGLLAHVPSRAKFHPRPGTCTCTVLQTRYTTYNMDSPLTFTRPGYLYFGCRTTCCSYLLLCLGNLQYYSHFSSPDFPMN